MTLAACLCVFLAAASSESVMYRKVGDDAVLVPDVAVTAPFTIIIWRDGANIAIQWEGAEMDSYRHFKERGRLDTSNGVMTITGLVLNDSRVYTPQINNVKGTPIQLIVLSPVPVPTVMKSCDDEMTKCVLTCGGDAAGAAPVSYQWWSDETSVSTEKEHFIVKDDSSEIQHFTCGLTNAVSQERSQPISNPFTTAPTPTPGQPKLYTGLTVFGCLLAAVVLLVLFHRCRTGVWFFDEASMPWEADFWRKNERQHVPESNGTAARQQTEQTDEETPMT